MGARGMGSRSLDAAARRRQWRLQRAGSAAGAAWARERASGAAAAAGRPLWAKAGSCGCGARCCRWRSATAAMASAPLSSMVCRRRRCTI
eukprot:360679-Chlamydomonas_euryale.AAC.9